MEAETTILPPQARSNFVGSPGIEQDLSALVGRGTVAGGWIIEGPDGIGKTTLAFRMARAILAGPKERRIGLGMSEESRTFRMVAGGAHPDLKIAARREKKTGRGLSADVTVDTIHEEVLDLLQRTPAISDWRVVIIDEADAMNKHAANALLKILEEPPQKSVLLLTSAAPAAMPSTIRSRCRRIRLTRRPVEEIEIFLEQEGLTEGAATRTVAEAARGRPGRAAILASKSGAEAIRSVREIIGLSGDMSQLRKSGSLKSLQADEVWSLFVELLLETLAEKSVKDCRDPQSFGRPAMPDSVRARLLAHDEVQSLLRRGRALNLDRYQIVLATARVIARTASFSQAETA